MPDTSHIILNHILSSYKIPISSYTYDNFGFTFNLDKEKYITDTKPEFITLINFNKFSNNKYYTDKFIYYIKNNIKILKILNISLNINNSKIENSKIENSKNEKWKWTIDCSNINSIYKLNKLLSLIITIYNKSDLNNCQEIHMIAMNSIYKYITEFRLHMINLKF
jgi:hypothetical protein